MAGYTFSRSPREVPPVSTPYRLIGTSIPAPGTEELLARLDRYESRSMHGQLPLAWARANGCSIYDHAGNKWIDFTSTIFVTNIGHANPRLLAAIRKVLDSELIHTYAYPNEIRATYLKRLVEFAAPHAEKAFLLSAGTEATEAALKLMRMNGQRTGKRRLGIVCVEGNWHGRTLGAQMMSSNAQQKEWIGYHDPHIHHIPFPYPWVTTEESGEAFLMRGIRGLEEQGLDLRRDVCGFLLETFQGWGAVFYPVDFVAAIERLCRANGILLAFDEMQGGFARTGRRFGFEHYGAAPDLICCGKGIGSGLSLSGVLGRKDVMDLPEIGNMSSTHSANPLVCAAGLATLEEIERLDLVNESERKGRLLMAALAGLRGRFPHRVSHVLGRGLIAACLFRKAGDGAPDAEFASRVSERCMQKGLLVVHTGRESIKIGPPLTIPDDALLEGIGVLEEAVAEIDAGKR